MNIIRPFQDIKSEYTQVHNFLFDEIMPALKPNAWKVLCFIVRKTYGWHKDDDKLSFSQIRQGTGISSDMTVSSALKELAAKKYIIIHKSDDQWEANTYSLNAGYEVSTTETVAVSTTETVAVSTTETVDTKERKETERNTPDGKNDKPNLTEHEQDELMVYGLYGNSSQQPPDDSIEAEIINSGWDIKRSPLVFQALIEFLLACREVGLGLQIPNSDTRRGDWFKSLAAHVDDFGIDGLGERYQATLALAIEDKWLKRVGRPGSLDRTLPTVQLANGHKTLELF